jgi:hypothetical protein
VLSKSRHRQSHADRVSLGISLPIRKSQSDAEARSSPSWCACIPTRYWNLALKWESSVLAILRWGIGDPSVRNRRILAGRESPFRRTRTGVTRRENCVYRRSCHTRDHSQTRRCESFWGFPLTLLERHNCGVGSGTCFPWLVHPPLVHATAWDTIWRSCAITNMSVRQRMTNGFRLHRQCSLILISGVDQVVYHFSVGARGDRLGNRDREPN